MNGITLQTQEIVNELKHAQEDAKQICDELAQKTREINKLRGEHHLLKGRITELKNKIPALYYPQLEATKVYQLILDQPGMFRKGRLVCKKWNDYLMSKPRPNLILSLLVRSVIGSRYDPYPKFVQSVKSNRSRPMNDRYFCRRVFRKEKDNCSKEELRELSTKYREYTRMFSKQKALYRRLNGQGLTKLNSRNQQFYDSVIIQNLIDHPIGARLIDIYNKVDKLFLEPLGSQWHITEYILPYIHLDQNNHNCVPTFYKNLEKYLSVTSLFPGYKHVPAKHEKVPKRKKGELDKLDWESEEDSDDILSFDESSSDPESDFYESDLSEMDSEQG